MLHAAADLLGQGASDSLTGVLHGARNPGRTGPAKGGRDVGLKLLLSSGCLPFTIGKSIDDYPSQVITSGIVETPHDDGILTDYRDFNKARQNFVLWSTQSD